MATQSIWTSRAFRKMLLDCMDIDHMVNVIAFSLRQGDKFAQEGAGCRGIHSVGLIGCFTINVTGPRDRNHNIRLNSIR